MRMRKKKNLSSRMEACQANWITQPAALRGRWRDLFPTAREVRVEDASLWARRRQNRMCC